MILRDGAELDIDAGSGRSVMELICDRSRLSRGADGGDEMLAYGRLEVVQRCDTE